MAYNYPLNFGDGRSGLAPGLVAVVYGVNGQPVEPQPQGSIVELTRNGVGTGSYLYFTSQMPSGLIGSLVIFNGDDVYARSVINPNETEPVTVTGTGTGTGTAPPPVSIPTITVTPGLRLCTDETIALMTNEFRDLCDRSQMLARGTDASIQAEDPWTLRSDSVDFEAAGIKYGHIIYLISPKAVFGGEPGQAYAVESTAGFTATLRVKGELAGQGSPPGSRTQGIIDIKFDILTLGGQILQSSREILDRTGLARIYAGRELTLSGEDAAILANATAAHVISNRYSGFSPGTTEKATEYATKSKMFYDRVNEYLSRLNLRLESSDPVRRPRRWARTY